MQMQEFFQILQYLLATNSIDIIASNFSDYLLKKSENKLLDIFTDYVQVNKPTDHVYIKKAFMDEVVSHETIENIFSRSRCCKNYN